MLQHGLHLELVAKPCSLGVRPHLCNPGVDPFLATRPVDLERLPEVLFVAYVKESDVELDLVFLGGVLHSIGLSQNGVGRAHTDDVGNCI